MPDPPEDPPQPAPGQQPDPQVVAQYQQAKAAYDREMAPFRKWEKDRTQAAEDATEAVNYIFMRRQDGFKILLDWLQSGLLEKIGIIKTACITEAKKTKQSGVIGEDELAMLDQEGVKPIAATDNGDGTWQVTIERKQQVKRYVDYPIPSEEFLFSARTRDPDSAFYLAHRTRKTISELIEMGFDREQVEALPTDDSQTDLDARAIERWDDEITSAVRRPMGTRMVWLMEEYARADRDDDGIAELLQIFRVDGVILTRDGAPAIEEVDEQPFVVWTPFPRAHRMVGNSLAEKVMDIQRVNSVLLRQALDGTYQTNAPRMAVDMASVTDDTLDDLLVIRPGGLVRYRGANAPTPLHESFDITKSLGMMEFMMGQRETRTGITRLNQGLDEDTINKTASGQAAMMATGQQMEEFVARCFAEAMARLFSKKLRLMADHGNAIAIKVDGAYRRVDPSSWDDQMNVAVRVGLGSGRKEQRLVYRQGLAQMQVEGVQYGLTDPKRIYNNMAAMVRDANLGNPSDYWIDPDSDEFKAAQANRPPEQNPDVMKVQADAQIAQAKMQMDAQSAQQKQQLAEQVAAAQLQHTQDLAAAQMEGQREEAAFKLQLAREQAEQQAALAEAKAQREADLAQQKAEFEAQLAQQQADREFALAEQQAQRRHELAREQAAAAHAVNMTKAESAIPKNRPGGDLSK